MNAQLKAVLEEPAHAWLSSLSALLIQYLHSTWRRLSKGRKHGTNLKWWKSYLDVTLIGLLNPPRCSRKTDLPSLRLSCVSQGCVVSVVSVPLQRDTVGAPSCSPAAQLTGASCFKPEWLHFVPHHAVSAAPEQTWAASIYPASHLGTVTTKYFVTMWDGLLLGEIGAGRREDEVSSVTYAALDLQGSFSGLQQPQETKEYLPIDSIYHTSKTAKRFNIPWFCWVSEDAMKAAFKNPAGSRTVMSCFVPSPRFLSYCTYLPIAPFGAEFLSHESYLPW